MCRQLETSVLNSTWTFGRCPLTKSNSLLKVVRLPVLFGSLVIFPSNDGQITSSRVLFAMKEFIRDKSHRQGSYLPREFIAVKDSHVPAYCNAETFRNGFRDNLSDYIIFRRRSTGGDFSVPQYIHSFGAAMVLTSTSAGRQAVSHFTGIASRTDPDKHHFFA